MIRRGFWFATGAVAGIAGYRRASRAVRTLLPSGPARAVNSPNVLAVGKTAAGTADFVRDVRAGMAAYLDQHRSI